MKYIVREEYRPNWNSLFDTSNDELWEVDEQEIKRLAIEWDVPLEHLMEQVDEI